MNEERQYNFSDIRVAREQVIGFGGDASGFPEDLTKHLKERRRENSRGVLCYESSK